MTGDPLLKRDADQTGDQTPVKAGTLYGVGVGPGDPELLTLKAHRLITSASTIAYFCKGNRPGHGRTVIADFIPDGCREIRMAYPITTEIPVNDPRYSEALTAFYNRFAEEIAVTLSTGENVVIISEGDPFFYGSFMPLFHRLSGSYDTVVVPGVPAMVASWAEANKPITYGDDVLSVIPGTLPAEDITRHAANANALIVMKLGRHLDKVRTILSAVDRLDDAVYVERCTMAGERILPLSEADAERAPYFSLILVPGKGRCL